MFDVANHIRAITREVGIREHEGRPARVVVATRRFDTTPDDLWDAITNPERIPRWFSPVTGDLRLGGRYHIQGNASGTVTRCDPPAHLALTWEFGGETSWVAVRLIAEDDGATTLELEHVAHVGDDRWGQYGPGAVGVGWDLSLLGLAEHLAGTRIDPAAVEAWMVSEGGRAFVEGSSDGWCAAAIRAGEAPERARGAAARTTAFYTGTAAPSEVPG